MDSRRMRSRVMLQSPPTGRDSVGQPSGSWTSAATVYADIRSLAGLEAIKAGADVSVVRASIRIRFREDVTAAWRVVHGATTYEVQAVLPDAGRLFVDLACQVVQ